MLGHPVHPAVAHLPIGLLVSVAIWDLAVMVLQDSVWWTVSFWSLALGTAAALPASLTGLFDFARIAEASDAETIARRHMYAALAAVACYGTSLVLRGGPNAPANAYGFGIGFAYVGLGFLMVAGWLGGNLVFSHGIGAEHRQSEAKQM